MNWKDYLERNADGRTNVELGALAGVSGPQVGKWRSGKGGVDARGASATPGRPSSHVVVHHRRLRHGVWGLSNGRDRIWLDDRLLQVERRCTLAHELEHIRRGHEGCQSEVVERRVSHAAARYLLPNPHHVADALVWASGCLHAAADELWVDEPTLRARLDPAHLHPAERAIITRRVEGLQP